MNKIKQGSTSRTFVVFIGDSRSGTGAGLTGLAYNSAGLAAYYKADTASSATAITLVTATVGTFTSGGFKEIDATNFPGLYEVGVPNAAMATGKSVTIYLGGAANMVPAVLSIELDQIDYQDATRAGLAALPPANHSAAGGLPTVGTGTGQIELTDGGITIANNVAHGGLDATFSLGTFTVEITGSLSGSVGSLAAQARTDVQTAMTAQGYTSARAATIPSSGTIATAANVTAATSDIAGVKAQTDRLLFLNGGPSLLKASVP